jgi:hypothetical protein
MKNSLGKKVNRFEVIMPILFAMLLLSPTTAVAQSAANGSHEVTAPLVFSGLVLERLNENRTVPLAGAYVELYCSDNSSIPGIRSAVVNTSADGSYRFLINHTCAFYNILIGGQAGCSASTVRGHVVNESWIQYQDPMANKVLEDNDFIVCSSAISCPKGCQCLLREEARKLFNTTKDRATRNAMR